ncbi:unnamed protein product [Xyrichtys novacula]|uniref:Unnamed protein product n=1 Tax=Xyrichtys novacula TaxID=13765 RepID=A0AAV1G045_XYRNO|nr:unnamed protein product [Xyrichtys novacula]
MFPQAIVEGKVIFRESLNVREVFKHFFFSSWSLTEEGSLEVLRLGIDTVETEVEVQHALHWHVPFCSGLAFLLRLWLAGNLPVVIRLLSFDQRTVLKHWEKEEHPPHPDPPHACSSPVRLATARSTTYPVVTAISSVKQAVEKTGSLSTFQPQIMSLQHNFKAKHAISYNNDNVL